jgi:hypothetical protein
VLDFVVGGGRFADLEFAVLILNSMIAQGPLASRYKEVSHDPQSHSRWPIQACLLA